MIADAFRLAIRLHRRVSIISTSLSMSSGRLFVTFFLFFFLVFVAAFLEAAFFILAPFYFFLFLPTDDDEEVAIRISLPLAFSFLERRLTVVAPDEACFVKLPFDLD